MTLLATSPCLEHSPCQEAPPQLFSALSRNRARRLRLSHLPELTCLVTDVTALAALPAPAAAETEPLVPASAIGACPQGVRLRAAVSPPQQVVALPTQEPTEHWSLQVVGLPSSQTVPLGWNPFAGQLALVPLQASATSQTPAAGRHTVVLALYVLAGQ